MKTEQKIIDEMISSIVLWWTDQLAGSPKRLLDDKESLGSILTIMISGQSGKKDITKDAKVKFAETLKTYLEQKSKNQKENLGKVILGTDYIPEWPLSDICQKSGVTGSRFPKKTTMWINFKDKRVTWQTLPGAVDQIYPLVEK
jgi:hypothetical protein